MQCVISPLVFVLVMEMILRSVEDNANTKTVLSTKAFIDDVTLIVQLRTYIELLVTSLQQLLE